MKKFFTVTNITRHTLIAAALVALYFISRSNFLLFHAIAEGFSILVAFSIFLFAWHTRRMLHNNFFVMAGMAFLFTGILDFFHTLAYRGMGVFDITGANIATQLWISARYVQSLSILTAVFFINRKIRPGLILPVYILVTALLLLSVFSWETFPACYIEGAGLTPFKIISEYLISFITIVSMILIWLRRDRFDSRIVVLIIISLGVAVLAEMAFTLYQDVYGITNALGHFLKLISFYLMYVAIIESGLKNPLSTLFNDLQGKSDELKEEVNRRKEAENSYRHSIENSPVCTHIFSKQGQLLFINKAGLALSGYDSLKDFSASPAEKLLTSESLVKSVQWDRERETGKALPDKFTLDIVRKNGEIRHIDAVRSEVFWDGETQDQIIFHDSTEQKKAEEREKKFQEESITTNRLAAIGRMASGIAHEINNPLTWVMGYAEFLLERELPEDVMNDIKAINDGARRMSSITRRMLAFARRREPERTSENVNEIIADTLKMRSYDMKVNNINLSLNLEPKLPEVFVDRGQIQQVFLNILLNAEIEMENAHHGGNLTILTETVEKGIRISFVDDGPGIKEENIDKIFEPFFTTRDVGEGTGLGLSVSYGIISQHGGKIYARSVYGQGASFIIELPFGEVPGKTISAAIDENTDKTKNVRILVVDDEQYIRSYLNDLLTGKGYLVELAEDGKKALSLMESTHYDVILLDIKMPGLTGIDVYEQLLDMSDASTGNVIFVTGDVMNTDTMSYILSAEIPFINKPFEPAQIYRAINRIITA